MLVTLPPNNVSSNDYFSFAGTPLSTFLFDFCGEYAPPPAPIGQLQPTQQSPYEPGQLILHRLFGYRGVVLCSWKASLFEMKKITLEVDPPDNP
ncbi:polymerase delta-interacting protein 2 [Taenia solium]|eukprot:TsM_001082200 transcript=TsM_001082200 gene=TsM_001082200